MKLLKSIIESIPTPILAIGGGLLILLIVSLSIYNNQGDAEQNEGESAEETVDNSTASNEVVEVSEEEPEEAESTENKEVTENEELTNTQSKTIESTVKNFSKNFLNLDSKEPEESIEKSKVYMTEELYEEQKNFRYEGNWDEYRVEHKNIKVDVLPESQDRVYKVAVESKGQAYDKDDNETKTQDIVLLLDVVKQGNSYLIDNISYETNE